MTGKMGRFYVQRRKLSEDSEEIFYVFQCLKIVPFDIKYNYVMDAFEYIAFGERFEEVNEGVIVPEYDIEITRGKRNQIIWIEVRKVKDRVRSIIR